MVWARRATSPNQGGTEGSASAEVWIFTEGGSLVFISILLPSCRESGSCARFVDTERGQEQSILSGERISLEHSISMTQNHLSRIKNPSLPLFCSLAYISLRIPWVRLPKSATKPEV